MRKRKGQLLSFLLIIALAMTTLSAQTVAARTSEEIQKDQEENKKNQEKAQSDKAQAEDVLDGLEDEAADLKDTYDSYNSRLASVNDEIAETEEAIASTNADIAELEEELATAKENQQAQYDGMKKRIQYMYENGSQSLLVSLLESGSIVEFVQRADYIASITNYDRTMVEAYAKLQDTIEEKTAALSDKQEQLTAYSDTLSDKQDELGELVTDAKSAYSAKSGEVSAAQMTVAEYNAKIAEYQALEESLAGEQAAAQAALAQQIAQQEQQQQQTEDGTTSGDSSNTSGGMTSEDTSGALNGYTESDLILMAAIIQAEADGESYEGKLAVGSVVMNRVMSSKFPNTLSGVIYQTNQFQPARDGHLALILERGPNDTCISAARQVLNGYRSGPWLFFMTKYWADYYGIANYTMIGNHAFFEKWATN